VEATGGIGPSFDWTEDGIKGAVVCNGVIPLIPFLVAECNADSVGEVEVGI